MRNQVVVHYGDGRIRKGFAVDFFPNKESFHLSEADSGETVEIQLSDLKGIFFVKSFEGDPAHQRRTDVERAGLGKKIRVDFKDGEALLGYTSGYNPGRTGFFVFPMDAEENNENFTGCLDRGA